MTSGNRKPINPEELKDSILTSIRGNEPITVNIVGGESRTMCFNPSDHTFDEELIQYFCTVLDIDLDRVINYGWLPTFIELVYGETYDS